MSRLLLERNLRLAKGTWLTRTFAILSHCPRGFGFGDFVFLAP